MCIRDSCVTWRRSGMLAGITGSKSATSPAGSAGSRRAKCQSSPKKTTVLAPCTLAVAQRMSMACTSSHSA
eukprot:8394201-Prorocentrum_lima.AAC.1